MKPAVLIVDDSLTVRMDLGDAFSEAGFTTTLCATLADARHALARSAFELVILDVQLPDGDGVEFLKEIKTTAMATPVMLLSTEAEVHDRIRGLTTGADEYVGKPYDRTYVIARGRELLRKNVVEAQAGKRSILVIDDSMTLREQLKAALIAEGYDAITAATGEDGLRLAFAMRPHAIIVDGQLPGIDGATVIRRIRADAVLRRTPCILLTGSEANSSELQALDSGADAYLRKEEDAGVVLARLRAIFRSAAPLDSGSAASSLLGPKKILAVDDSLTYLNAVAAQLRQEGYDVVLAHSGEEALELLGVQMVDCILLDLIMPGLSGQETCRRIKSTPAWRDIPLIMHTAKDDREAMIEGINAGADDYIAKSSEFEVLRARLRAQLRRKQFEDENRHIREQLQLREIEAASARAAREVADVRAQLLADLQQINLELVQTQSELEEKNHRIEEINQELESFSYSVAHDLRAPLRSIDGFSQALAEDYASLLDDDGKKYLRFVRESAQQMGQLIDDLLTLARVTRSELALESVDLSTLVQRQASRLARQQPDRRVEIVIRPDLHVDGDARLLAVVVDNLLGNAWKFTGKSAAARIEFGATDKDGRLAYFMRDNGAGFDMAFASKLFGVFQRLHSTSEFEGTGVGLATVKRIVARHGGRVWAEAAVGAGATFYFTIGDKDHGGGA